MGTIGWSHAAQSQQNSALQKAFDDLAGDSERAAAIVACSFVDENLTAALKLRFSYDEEIFEDLFEGAGPLATFSTRIKMGYLSGFLTHESMKDLHAIRKIRNEFAHVVAVIGFNQKGRIYDLARTLTLPYRVDLKLTPGDPPDEAASIRLTTEEDRLAMETDMRLRYMQTCKCFSVLLPQTISPGGMIERL